MILTCNLGTRLFLRKTMVILFSVLKGKSGEFLAGEHKEKCVQGKH